jgi:hypothetical protein
MRLPCVLASLLLAMAITAGTTFADQSQHTTQLPLTLTPAGASAGHPALRSGHVVNTHTSGSVNFAIEDYMVNGAKPNTTYQVVLRLFGGTCAGPFLFAFPNGATLATDAQGNAHSQDKISPADVAAMGLHNKDFGIVWTLAAGSVSAYSTACTNVHID